jgi:hypothetical protein
MRVDPDVYVVRHPSGYALYPFDGDVCKRLNPNSPMMDADTVLKAIQHLDVSVIMSADGSTVCHAHGCDITLDILESSAPSLSWSKIRAIRSPVS